jgi:hypothetical protein
MDPKLLDCNLCEIVEGDHIKSLATEMVYEVTNATEDYASVVPVVLPSYPGFNVYFTHDYEKTTE